MMVWKAWSVRLGGDCVCTGMSPGGNGDFEEHVEEERAEIWSK